MNLASHQKWWLAFIFLKMLVSECTEMSERNALLTVWLRDIKRTAVDLYYFLREKVVGRNGTIKPNRVGLAFH